VAKIQQFFIEKKFEQVWTPPIVTNPGMETHLHPIAISAKHSEGYLQTSPEFAMKEILSFKDTNIFTIGYSFRDEPTSETHRSQFLMLEWYRSHTDYLKILNDCKELLTYLQYPFPVEHKTVDQLFLEYLDFSILNYLDKDLLADYISSNHQDIPLGNDPSLLEWEDYYFLLFLNKIEPHLKDYPAIIINQFPEPLKALSNISPQNPNVCQRFELYLNGIEIANCFDELIDINEQKRRFKKQSREKMKLYGYQLPEPNSFYQSLERGLPPCAGIALGIERLYMAINQVENPFWN